MNGQGAWPIDLEASDGLLDGDHCADFDRIALVSFLGGYRLTLINTNSVVGVLPSNIQ